MNRRTSVRAIAVYQGTTQGRTRRARLGALAGVGGLLLSLLGGCGSRISESSGGETHWLVACGGQEGCGDGLDCICGRCSTSCSSDAMCREIDTRATCLLTEEVSYANGCASAPLRICGEVAEAVNDARAAEAPEDGQAPSASPYDGSAPEGGTVTPTGGSSDAPVATSTAAGMADAGDATSEPPSTTDGLPTPEGWDGLKLIDPYSDKCVITDTLDRNTEPNGEEGLGYLQFACSGGPTLTALCMLEDPGLTERLWTCSCFGGEERTANSKFSFEDVGLTETEACRIAGALCVTELPTEVARAQETCTPGTPTITPDSCGHQADCVRTVTVGDVVLEQTLENQASCSWEGGDVALCSCTGLLSSAVPLFTSPGTSDESCSVATSLCNDGVDAGSLGAIECTLDPEFSDQDELWCDEIYECAQPAVVQGHAVEFSQQARGHCDREKPSDPWTCSCWEGEQAPLEARDATTACQLNLERCLEIRSGDLREW